MSSRFCERNDKKRGKISFLNFCNRTDVKPKLYDGTDPKLWNVRALYELLQFVKGQPKNNAQACNGRMLCFLLTVPFSLLSSYPSPTLCVANNLLASDSLHKYNRQTRFGSMYCHLTCVQTDERHRQGWSHQE